MGAPGTEPPREVVEQRLLWSALEQARAAACITTAQLDLPGPEIVYVNPAYCRMTGRRREEVLGRTPRIMQGPLTDRGVLDRLRSDLDAGRPFSGETVNYRADGTPFLIDWQVDPVVDADGTVTHFVATQSDVTAERRAADLIEAQRLVDRALAAALQHSTPPDIDALLAVVVDGASRLARYGRIGVDVELTVADQRRRHRAGEAAGPDDPGWELGAGPVRGRLALTGLSDDEAAFVPHAELETFATTAARAVAAACEYEDRRYVALTLQEALLPDRLGTIAGWDVAARYVPGSRLADVGGDWYDVVPIERDSLAAVVGDVTGNGVRAAAEMGRLRAGLRARLDGFTSPAEALASTGRDAAERDVLATALVVVADGSMVRMASAGHPRPVLRRANGAIEPVDLVPAPPLGFGADRRREWAVTIGTGDMLVLFTDGLIERRRVDIDLRLVELDRLVVAGPSTPSAMIDHLFSGLLGDGDPTDDCVVLVMRRSSDGSVVERSQ